MAANDALVLVLSRNAFYKRLHILVLSALMLNIVVILMLMGTLLYLIKNPTKPLYFAADEIGRLIQITPVNLPNMSQEKVTEWTTNAVQEAFSFDYINYRDQLQRVENYFTSYGWTNFMKALADSGNMRALLERRQVVLAQVIEKPALQGQGYLQGALAWKYKMPLLVIYTMPPYDGSNQFSNSLVVEVTVQRQKILQGDNGLGIIQLVSKMPNANQVQPVNIQ